MSGIRKRLRIFQKRLSTTPEREPRRRFRPDGFAAKDRGAAHRYRMDDRITGGPAQVISLSAARERLSLTSGEMDEIVSEGLIKVEQDVGGPHTTELGIAAFRASEQEQKLRAMREITRISNKLGFFE